MSIQEVDSVHHTNAALDAYQKAFKERYGVEPAILNIGIALTFFKDITRKFGLDRTLALTRHFLSDRSDYYTKQGHSVRAMEKNIEAINASLAMKETLSIPTRKGPMSHVKLSFETQCPQCKNWHTLICAADEMDKWAHTKWCKACEESLQT